MFARMSKKRIVAIAALLAAGVVGPFIVPPALEHAFRLRFVLWGAALLAALLRDFGAAVQAASAVALPPDTVVILEGPANFKNGWVMIGGVLKLTRDQLLFSAHGFAQNARVYAWELQSLDELTPANTLGLVPNAIEARFGAVRSKLVMEGRDAWMSAIRAAAANAKANAQPAPRPVSNV
jgi:hypothetical protein